MNPSASFANPWRPLRSVFEFDIKTIAAPAFPVRANAAFDPQPPALPWWAWRARLRQRWAGWWQARLPRTDLHVTSGATLNLAFTGKQYVHALFVNGAPMPGGCYTAANAAWITGPGTLIVTYPPSGSILFLR